MNNTGNNKIIICAHLLNDYSGSPKVLSQSIRAFKEIDTHVILYTGSRGEGFLTNLTKHHYLYFYLHSKFRFITLINYFISQISLFFKIFKYRNKNVVIYINTLLPFGAAVAGKIIGKRVVYHIHETSVSPKILKIFLRKVASLCASEFIFVSSYLANQEKFIGKKHNVIHNSLSSDFIDKAYSKEYPKIDSKSNFNILMACSLKEYKGISKFIAVARSCIHNPNMKFELVLNSSNKNIKSYFKNKDLPYNLQIFDRQKNMHKFYSRSNLVLNLSIVEDWVETFGLTLIEAMAYGIPVIAPPIGGPDEIIDDGIHGFKINSHNIDQISLRINELYSDHDLFLRLSKNCKKHSQKFTEKKYTANILNIIR